MQLEFCTIEWTDYGCVTFFEDGSEASAWPSWADPHYRVIAHRTGYGDDLLGYCREHDFCHSLIEQEIYKRPSRVLWAMAHGTQLPGPESAYEELAAQALQRFFRAGERPIVSGIDWDGIRNKAHGILDNAYRHRKPPVASLVREKPMAADAEQSAKAESALSNVRRARLDCSRSDR